MHWFFDNFLSGVFRFIVATVLWNWVPIMSALAAIGAAAWAWIGRYSYLQIVLTGLAAFAVVLWTLIGLVWITKLDDSARYAWSLAYQSMTLGLDTGNEDATLQLGINFVNVGPGAIKFKVVELRVIIDDRTIANPQYVNEGSTIPRGMSRSYRFPSFKRASVESFLGKRPNGIVEFSIAYGPYNSVATRRLKMKFNAAFRLDDRPGVADTIVSETDSPIE